MTVTHALPSERELAQPFCCWSLIPSAQDCTAGSTKGLWFCDLSSVVTVRGLAGRRKGPVLNLSVNIMIQGDTPDSKHKPLLLYKYLFTAIGLDIFGLYSLLW